MPYARIAVYTFKPGQVDEVIRLAKEGMLPIFQRQPGYRRYHVIRTGDDSAISMSSWETKQVADAAVQKAADWVKANVADKIATVQNYVGEVAFSDVASG
ncbi:MAG TPA: antibiotic biosynthesis monooxygenase [Chloroflexota bacterium]|nr:antibiotic biosynthesis monooxygenase [Chloroflexota bacterium]